MRFSKLPPHSILALVRARDQELIDEIALGTHDLDAVVAGVLGQLRTAHEILDLGLPRRLRGQGLGLERR
jgi:hypothetical protein